MIRGLDMTKEDAERVGVVVGTGLGGLPTHGEISQRASGAGSEQDYALLYPHADSKRGPGPHCHSIWHKGSEPLHCYCLCHRRPLHRRGLRIIQYGDADVMVAGGTEANLTPLTVGGFNAMNALSTRNDAP